MEQPARRSAVNHGDSELSRQAVHMLVGAFALLLRWLTYPQALACAIGAIVFNSLILPRLPGSRRRLYRPGEREHGFSVGILMYPIAVFLLILLFPVPVAASMWGVLAVGDALATIAGKRMGMHALPWNPSKTFEGFGAFLVGAIPASAFLYWWTLSNAAASPPWWRSVGAQAVFASSALRGGMLIAVVSACVCAVLESLKTPLDDNLLVPLGGACAMIGLLYVF